MTNLQKNPEYRNISLSERPGKVGGWLRRPDCRAGLQGPCHFERSTKCEVEKSAHPSQAFPCHFERSTKCEVEKSEHQPSPLSFRAKHAHLSFRAKHEVRSREICTSTKPPCHFERSPPPCHFERSTKCVVEKSAHQPSPLSFRAKPFFCHFERSPKGEVEKSDYQIRLCNIFVS